MTTTRTAWREDFDRRLRLMLAKESGRAVPDTAVLSVRLESTTSYQGSLDEWTEVDLCVSASWEGGHADLDIEDNVYWSNRDPSALLHLADLMAAVGES